jgi:hypothetical protein
MSKIYPEEILKKVQMHQKTIQQIQFTIEDYRKHRSFISLCTLGFFDDTMIRDLYCQLKNERMALNDLLCNH